MKKVFLLAALIAVTAFGSIKPASAQTIPNVKGLTPFTSETNYLSVAGYLRWQYFVENNVWISIQEANQLTASQTGTASPAGVEPLHAAPATPTTPKVVKTHAKPARRPAHHVRVRRHYHKQ